MSRLSVGSSSRSRLWPSSSRTTSIATRPAKSRRACSCVKKPADTRGPITSSPQSGSRSPASTRSLHQPEEAALLVAPALHRIAEPALALFPSPRVRRIGAAVQPGAISLQRQDRPEPRGDRTSRSCEIIITVFFDACISRSSASLAGTSRKLTPERGYGGRIRQLFERSSHDPATGRVLLSFELIATERRPIGDRRAELHYRRIIAGR